MAWAQGNPVVSPQPPRQQQKPLFISRILPGNMPSAVLVRQGDTGIGFLAAAFPSVQLGDEVFVLNAKATGVVARLRVVDLLVSGLVSCDLTEVGVGYSIELLDAGARVVRASDAREYPDAFAAGPLSLASSRHSGLEGFTVAKDLSRNPVGLLALGFKSGPFGDIDAALQQNLAMNATHTLVHFESYIPRTGAGLTGINFFGVEVDAWQMLAHDDLQVALPGTGQVQAARVSAKGLRVSLGVRLPFDYRLLSRVGILLGVYDSSSTQVTLSQAFQAPSESVSLYKRGWSLRVLWEAQPLEHFFTQVVFLLPFSQPAHLQWAQPQAGSARAIAQSEPAKLSGIHQTLGVKASLGGRVPLGALPNRFVLEAWAGIEVLNQKINLQVDSTRSSSMAGLKPFARSDRATLPFGLLGVGYVL